MAGEYSAGPTRAIVEEDVYAGDAVRRECPAGHAELAPHVLEGQWRIQPAERVAVVCRPVAFEEHLERLFGGQP